MFTMKKKDLAEEYAAARLQGRISGNQISFSENKVFTKEDIVAAFNAGRKSVMKTIPKLNWENCVYEHTAETPFGKLLVLESEFSNNTYLIKIGKQTLVCPDLHTAQLYVEGDYLYKIKQALGL